MNEIQIINNDTQVLFSKKLYHESELILAKCFGFEMDVDTGKITASIAHTSKESMYAFIKTGFKSFSEAIDRENERVVFYEKLDMIYENINNFVQNKINELLPYASKFYLHQREGIRFAYFNRCAFLAFTMRLGKSVVAASISRVFNIRRTLIICPSVAKSGWFYDLTNIWGFNQLYFTMLDASKKKTWIAFQERFVIVNYDTIEKFKHLIMKDDIGHIIIDEAHRIKNRNSNKYNVISEIAAAYPHAKITFLSGTAIPNRFDDLFAYFKLSGHYLGESYKKFTDEFTTKRSGRGGDKVNGAKNISDLKMKMSNFMLVRSMEDCFDMPEDIISRYTFELDDYRPEYDKIIKEMSEQKSLSSLNGSLHSLNIITSKSKIKGIIEALEDIVEETGKVVVFGSYKEPLSELEAYFGARCVKVDGSVASSDRFALRTRFMEDPSVQVFLGNYLAAGEALDLSVASDVMTLNFPFTPRELQQALFRCKHPEKKKHLRIHYTFCKESIDEHIFNIVVDKTRDINTLLHDGKDVVEIDNMNELLIKKLLNRDDIVFDNHVSKAKPVVTEEKVEEKLEQGLPQPAEQRLPDQGGQRSTDERATEISDNGADFSYIKGSVPQYHLMLNPNSESLYILNQEELHDELTSGVSVQEEVLFSHEDIQKILIEGRHRQLRMKGGFTEDYCDNPKNLSEFEKDYPTGPLLEPIPKSLLNDPNSDLVKQGESYNKMPQVQKPPFTIPNFK